MTCVIRRLHAFDEAQIDALADVLIDCVEGGASVGFLAPLSRDTAGRYWESIFSALGEHLCLWVAESDGRVVGTWKVTDGKAPEPGSVTLVDKAFCGREVPTVVRAEFNRSGFTESHMRGVRFVGWRTTATLVTHVAQQIDAGEPFVYAYYDGVDKVAHEYGITDGFFSAETMSADHLVGDLLDALPDDVVLVITADHGQVQFEQWVTMEPVAPHIRAYAGDARLRYLYARGGREGDLLKAATDAFGAVAWVFGRDQLVEEGWLGPEPPPGDVMTRIGDVTLAAKGNVAFVDPTHPRETRLRAGHGSLSPDEMLVPLLAGRGRRS